MSLPELRERLAAVDRRILELIAERRELSSAVGQIKHREGLPTRDFLQERVVLQRARDHAVALGIAPDVAERLFAMLIHSSLAVQEQETVAAVGGGSGRRVLIIGGAGKMGRWLARFLVAQGYAVEITDPAGEVPGFPSRPGWSDGPLDDDFVVVATPLRASNRVLVELAARHPRGIVFDIASLKSPLRPGFAALRAAGVRATSIHPMFGPDTELLSGRHVILVDLGDAEATAGARAMFASTMATLVDMDLELHDRLIAYVLGLSHAVNIAFFTALAESGEAAPHLAELSSTTFDAQLRVAGAVAEENPKLYYDIQALNDYGADSLVALHDAVERLARAVSERDETAFVALMEQGRAYLSGARGARGRD